MPLVVAALLFFLMSTWRQGRAALARKLERDTLPLAEFIAQIHNKTRVPRNRRLHDQPGRRRAGAAAAQSQAQQGAARAHRAACTS